MIEVFIIVSIFIIVALLLYSKRGNKRVQIPFRESMELVRLPIVTFKNGNTKLHFLLDTGSDDSFISSSVIKKVRVKQDIKKVTTIATGGGSINSKGIVVFDIQYKDKVFENTFIVSDLDEAFKAAVGNRGVKLHGILGSVFFEKYKYSIDFKEMTAYSKK